MRYEMNRRKSLRLVFSLWTLGTFFLICLPSVFWISQEMLDLRRTFADHYSGQQAADIRNRTMQRLQSYLSSCFQLAASPAVRSWLKNEFHPVERAQAFATFTAFSRNMENTPTPYAVVSSSLRYYRNNEFKSLIVKDRPLDSWYFRTLSRTNRFMLYIDYDPALDLTHFWINVPVHESADENSFLPAKPLGLVGAGIDISVFLHAMLEIEFKDSFITFFNEEGIIMAYKEIQYIKKNTVFSLLDRASDQVSLSNLMQTTKGKLQPSSLSITHQDTRYLASLAWIPLSDWYVLVAIDPSAVISFERFFPLMGAISTALIILFLSMLVFINRKLINPIVHLSSIMTKMQGGDLDVRVKVKGQNEIAELNRACNAMAEEIQGHTSHLKELVHKRTEELVQKNHEILNSIFYARLVQTGMLPQSKRIAKRIPEHSINWHPRDIVSGDSYWYKETDENLYLAVIDCAGQSVPAAFMTMTVHSVLNHIVWYLNDDPAAMLMELDRLIRVTFNQEEISEAQSNNGLDIALLMIQPEKKTLTFSGARIPLFYLHDKDVQRIRSDEQSIGYINAEQILTFSVHEIQYTPGDRVFISTDGLFNQPGKEGLEPFGIPRFSKLVRETAAADIETQCSHILQEVEHYSAANGQTDDITLVALVLP